MLDLANHPSLRWFIEDMIRMAKDWPLGTVLFVIIVLVSLFCLAMIFWGIFIAVDSWFLPRMQGLGQIVGRSYSPAHTTYVSNTCNGVTTMTPIYCPASWSVCVEVDGLQDSVGVSQDCYDSAINGSPAKVDFVIGRFSRKMYIKEIYSS